MEARARAQVRKRAGNRCEYCQLRQEDSPLAALHVEHIVPKTHGGTDESAIKPTMSTRELLDNANDYTD